jgi:NAD(P)-dependent dehydrogenase (short-subunit alcohol dehydrogenase family)
MTGIDYSSLIRLDGCVFAVFGTGAGIGGETVRALSTLGAKVACLDLDAAAAEAAATKSHPDWTSPSREQSTVRSTRL